MQRKFEDDQNTRTITGAAMERDRKSEKKWE